MKSHLVRKTTLCSTLVLACALTANAQTWPERPVKIVVGYVAGGGPDSEARLLGTKLSEVLKQSFVVENRPGAGGTLSSAVVAKSPPDGYTLLLGDAGQTVIAPFLFKSLPYDTLRDFAPVALVGSDPILLVTSAKSGIKSMQDLIREAKANPGKLSYGSSGVGSIHHIAAETLKKELGINLVHVPYKGSGQSVPAVLAGDVPVLMAGYASAAPHIKAGTLNVLGSTSAKRLSYLPNVPALSEFINGYSFPAEMGVLAPLGVAPAIVNRLSDAIAQAVRAPDLVARFMDVGTVVNYMPPAEYAAHLRSEIRKYDAAVKLAGVQPE